MALEIRLRDRSAAVVSAWRSHFAGVRGVEISQGDIFGLAADAIVSPANSYGFMDGGIDRVYSERFGWDLQRRLQDRIRSAHGGLLPVGEALVIETGAADLPWLVSAPTMKRPGNVAETDNAFLAFRAALAAVAAFNRGRGKAPIRTLLCPGLCTAAGRMPPERSAEQMRRALSSSGR